MKQLSVKKSLAWMGGTSLLGQIITWSVTILVARLLTPEDYGLVALAGLFTVFANSICLMGISAAVVQADEVTEYQIRALYGLSFLAGLIMYCIGLAAAPVMAWIFSEPRLVALIIFQNLIFLVGAPKSLLWSLLARDTRFDIIAKVETGARIMTSFATLGMALAGFGVWALAAQWLLIETAQFLVFAYFRRIRPAFRIRFTEISDILSFGIKVFLRNVVGQLYNSVDVFILGKLGAASFLGGYTFAKRLANIPFEKIVTIINRVLYPYISKDKDNPESMREWTLKVAEFQAMLLLPFFVMLFFCADEAVFVLLGTGWGAAVLPLKIFCAANVFKLAENYASIALMALGKVTEQVHYVLIQLVAIGGTLLGLALWKGVNASLLVWVTVYPLLSILYCGFLLHSIGLDIGTLASRVRSILLANVLMGCALYGAGMALHAPLWQMLAMKIGIGGLAYVATLYLFGRDKLVMALDMLPRRWRRSKAQGS
ncbi:polysaccharide biosynthesis protein [Pseudodesulfovibrio mercurii]|uniref:Polysaccharide biosynthesis protein n=1 Tax=Pseudodesulfovibrio mercurii TaxID=641491 RepID=F0JCA3_9BACT|nr:lipopolysaccharide biosynthesis protein [Pseudodesulfovibrio mercurii]EGB14401.1 polysaccharide biosynthesis protein [Pseudodesulfovibrio mercurii]